MPRFYFHIGFSNCEVPDRIGLELPGVQAARQEALDGARDMLLDVISENPNLADLEYHVHDEAGRVVLSVPMREALTRS